MTARIQSIAFPCLLSLCVASGASAQSTSVYRSSNETASRLPAPVRHMQHYEALPLESADPWVIPPDLHTHQVIRAPGKPSANTHRPTGQHRQSDKRSPAAKHSQTHPPLAAIHRRVQPARANIPQARQRETWKTPYSYGYFGASGNRHWSLHYGYRDRYTEWRLQ